MGCMRPVSENAVICPHCAYNSLSVQHSPYLPKETVLLGRYTVGKVISVSSDKATYIGFDNEENRTVKIHEFLPQKLIIREPNEEAVTVRVKHEHLYYECMGSFESLWKNLQNIKGSAALDAVYDVFFLNNTVYAVCEHVDCITLKEYFDSRERLLTWSKACAAFKPVMSVLSRLHRQGIIHGDLSPVTVLVGSDGKLRLSSLTIPQTHGQISELTHSAFGGYAPIERCKEQSLLSASTDVYSLTALMYTAVTGLVPPPANARISADTLVLPSQIEQTMPVSAVEAFYAAMQVFPSARTKSIDEFMQSLSAQPQNAEPKAEEAPVYTPAPLPVPEKENQTEAEAQPKNRKPSSKKVGDTSSTSSIFFKSFFAAIVVILLVFTTLYTTFLYNYMSIPALDSLFSSFAFLPMNMEDTSETEPNTTSTTGPLVSVSQTVTVADFKTLRYQDIKQNSVFNSNFDLVYEFEYSDTYEKNAVISQSIPYGQTVNVGTTITLVISKGKEPVVLKDVIGMNYDDAYAVLTDDGFVVKKEVLENDGAQTPDEVFTMSLVAGLEFEKGTQITLSVWGEKEKETSKSNDVEQ